MNKQTKQTLKMAGYDLDGVITDVEKFDGFDDVCLETIKRVRSVIEEALSEREPAQEPVAWCVMSEYGEIGALGLNGEPNKPNYSTPLYTRPAKLKRLSNAEVFDSRKDDYGVPSKYWDEYARAIEQSIATKNGMELSDE
jgi:hypothetical protein